MNDIGGVIVHEFLGNELEVALRGPARLGEGPVWDAVSERLLWIDLLEGIVHRFDPTTGTDVNMHLDQAVGFVAPATDGGAIVGLRDGLALVQRREL
jgi:sugar lactone lactonase YvrE